MSSIEKLKKLREMQEENEQYWVDQAAQKDPFGEQVVQSIQRSYDSRSKKPKPPLKVKSGTKH
jgi:hypothetical protein